MTLKKERPTAAMMVGLSVKKPNVCISCYQGKIMFAIKHAPPGSSRTFSQGPSLPLHEGQKASGQKRIQGGDDR